VAQHAARILRDNVIVTNVISTGRKFTFNTVIASVRQLPGEAIQCKICPSGLLAHIVRLGTKGL
jgi:hypothetical protein